MPGTAEVLGSNLTRICFFFKRNVRFQIKLSANYFVCLSVSDIDVSSFFSCALFFKMLFVFH